MSDAMDGSFMRSIVSIAKADIAKRLDVRGQCKILSQYAGQLGNNECMCAKCQLDRMDDKTIAKVVIKELSGSWPKDLRRQSLIDKQLEQAVNRR
jgi:hypothetical protein